MQRRPLRIAILLRALLLGALTVGIGGCSFGPRSLIRSRLPYNEAVKFTSEQEMLLNIVRLRYADTPSSLAVTGIAAQFEKERRIGITPFFSAAGAGDGSAIRSFSAILPEAGLHHADRPTFTLTPQDDAEFSRRLFTPLSLEGALYLSRTTWPISTVFRLYLENLNWVPNAELASGPAPKLVSPYADFLRGVTALQALQNRGHVVFSTEERVEVLGGTVPAHTVTARDVNDAARDGNEYRTDGKGGWTLVKKKQQPVLHIHPDALASTELQEFVRTFHLKPGQTKYEVSLEKLNPFPVTYPPGGVTTIDLETRSLLQVLYYVSLGVEIPEEHAARGIATITRDEADQPFDWQQVLGGLFKVRAVKAKKAPPGVHLAVQYQGYWYFIDEADLDTKATFSLLMELSRLELARKGEEIARPLLTLPIGAR